MFLTIFLAVVFCAAITLMLIAAVAFIQKKEFFSSAPEEGRYRCRDCGYPNGWSATARLQADRGRDRRCVGIFLHQQNDGSELYDHHASLLIYSV